MAQAAESAGEAISEPAQSREAEGAEFDILRFRLVRWACCRSGVVQDGGTGAPMLHRGIKGLFGSISSLFSDKMLGIIALVVLILSISLITSFFWQEQDTMQRAQTAAGYQFGSLMTNPANIHSNYSAGLRWAEIEASWGAYEPSQGQYNRDALPISDIEAFKQAGFKVELSLGLHYPPGWAKTLEPWVDQKDRTYNAQPNWFNPIIQQAVWDVIHHMVADIGVENIDAVRIGGLHEHGEILYPEEPGYRYLAYSSSAMRGTSLIPANPVPAWRPGQASRNGEAKRFLNWYVGALAEFGNYQVRALRNAGFTGQVQWLMPGVGMQPNWRSELIANNLDLSRFYPNDYHISGGGAAWDMIIDKIEAKDVQTIITCTSLDDSTAQHANEGSTNVGEWSSAHWIAYNADRYNLRKSGESKGSDDYAQMQLAFRKMNEFGYEKLMWAWDDKLYNGQRASISNYATFIEQYSANRG